ncbi:MAG: hydantoinase/oxoprolinase N-terminal domain-containing protein, partial [Gemmobacter sp.]
MGYLLGVDTGGTYTDAVILDAEATRVIGKAKSLTTRGDLSLGIGRAVDAALSGAGVAPVEVAMVSPSTPLATNALVEGQGGRVVVLLARSLQDPRRGTPRGIRVHRLRHGLQQVADGLVRLGRDAHRAALGDETQDHPGGCPGLAGA